MSALVRLGLFLGLIVLHVSSGTESDKPEPRLIDRLGPHVRYQLPTIPLVLQIDEESLRRSLRTTLQRLASQRTIHLPSCVPHAARPFAPTPRPGPEPPRPPVEVRDRCATPDMLVRR
ncbi:MAG: hypothetical protein ACYTGN_01550 [Planctomycetota bacterium]|jgi:hypothetical protein